MVTCYVYVEVYGMYIPAASEICTEAAAGESWGGFWGEAGVMEGGCRGACSSQMFHAYPDTTY